MENYVIAIAREFGSGGKEIGMKLAKELGIPCYEQQILEMASEQSGINEALFLQTDEKLRGSHLLNLLRKKPMTYVVSPNSKDFVSDTNIFNIQAEVIKSLAQNESCIIIGKCADYVLRDYNNVVRIFIEAPFQTCAESISKKLYVDIKEAEQLVRKTNKYRADYYKYYTNGLDWKDSLNYDMTLNSDKIGREQCVELIKEYVKIKLGNR